MVLGLSNQVKMRTRSVHFDVSQERALAAFLLDTASTYPKAGRRSSSLALGSENIAPSTETHSAAGTIRRFRSMLEVEDAPKINPVEPMSFDELYATLPEISPKATETDTPDSQLTTNQADVQEIKGKRHIEDDASQNSPVSAH
jgi:septin 7